MTMYNGLYTTDVYSNHNLKFQPNSIYVDNIYIEAMGQNLDKVYKSYDAYQEEKKKLEEQLTRAKNKRLRKLVKHVHWSGNCCIVYWRDGTQTKAYWDDDEDFDPEKAILVCMARKLYENTGIYNEVFEKYADDGWDHYEQQFF